MSYPEVALPASVQNSLEEFAIGFLRQGRADWDEPHTRAVVFYAVLLAKAENQDIPTLFTTAWLHDIGYFGLFQDQQAKDWGQIKERKALHMEIGAAKSREFLAHPDVSVHYSPSQLSRIPQLVAVHDNIEDLTAPDELLFMEADTLGAMDISRVKPTFDVAGFEKYRATGLQRRWSRFSSETDRRLYRKLLPRLEKYFQG